MTVPGRFEGKVALVTGAGSGMGRAITLRLEAEGASVFAVDIAKGRLDETLEMSLGRVEVREFDLGDPDACVDAVAGCVDRFGRLDLLGNVAGIYLAEHTPNVTRGQYRRVMAVNLDAYFFLAQEAIPHLLETGGNIVNIASNAALMGVPYSAAYCMSIKTPLRVNAIAPAGTNTNIATGVTFPADMDQDLAVRMAGLRGMAEPDEVAALFAFLASGEARSITGAVYTLDNGLTVS
jgi:meso-butanediol dehydrogenase / (S,S)-butanediol dehydrogenase / diacetyl reductase